MIWTNSSKNISTWVNQTKNALISFLLQEDSFYLLLETGERIIINDFSYSNQTKNSSSYVNQTKN